MNIGDLYIADCPFADRAGSKKRLVIILRILDDGVAVIASRSKHRPEMTLVLKIDFDRDPNYSAVNISGVSHFYAENVAVLPIKGIQTGRFLDGLHETDYETLFANLGIPPV